MTRRTMTAILSAAICAIGVGTAEARDLTVTTWGGATEDAKKRIFFEPFAEASGKPLQTDVYAGGWAPFKAMQDTGLVPWDVVHVEAAEMDRGCEEGAFAQIDWDKIGGKDNFIPAAVAECGVGNIIWAMVIAYNGANIDKKPTEIEDFWDLQTWPGKRGMRQGPKANLELALMADGVAPADVYDVLSSPEGVDRAFAKLDEIKADVLWWKTGAQAPEWLVSGDVTFTIAYNNRVATAIQEGHDVGIVWDNTVYAVDFWVIPAESPYVEEAHELIKFTSDAKRQAEYSNTFANGPTLKAADQYINESQTPLLPSGKNIETGLNISGDESREFWADNLQTLTERWNAWVLQ